MKKNTMTTIVVGIITLAICFLLYLDHNTPERRPIYVSGEVSEIMDHPNSSFSGDYYKFTVDRVLSNDSTIIEFLMEQSFVKYEDPGIYKIGDNITKEMYIK